MKLISSLTPFTWSPETDHAFPHLKRLFTSAPILAPPDSIHQFIAEECSSLTQEWEQFSPSTPCQTLSSTLVPSFLTGFPPPNTTMMWEQGIVQSETHIREVNHWLKEAEQLCCLDQP